MERGLEFIGIEHYDVFEDDVMIFFIDISACQRRYNPLHKKLMAVIIIHMASVCV